jgi:hypothetical protein
VSRIIPYSEFVNEKIALRRKEAIHEYYRLVHDAYMAAPILDPNVTHHWDALARHSHKFRHQAMSDIKIEYVPKEVYPDGKTMKERIRKEGVMYISEEYKDHPYWSDEDYRCFRAVHDYIVHFLGDSDFTERGEMRACNLHSRLCPHEARPAVFTEITGKVSVWYTTGEFGPQKVAVLEGFDYVNIGVVHGHPDLDKEIE